MSEELFNVVDATQESAVEIPAEPVVDTVASEGASAEPAIQQTETKTTQTPDENAKYAAARRKAEAETAFAVQRARDEAAEALAQRFKIPNVKTFDDFERYGQDLELQQSGVDPEKYKALRENDPEIVSARKIREQHEKATKELQAITEFRMAVKDAEGREFDIATDFQAYSAIKAESDASGKSIADIMVKQQNAKLLSRIAEFEAKAKAQEVNKANADSTPGSVQTDGNTANSSVTEADIDAHANDVSWMRRHYKEVEKFYRK